MGTDVYVCAGTFNKGVPKIKEIPFDARCGKLFTFLSRSENGMLCIDADIGARKHKTRKFLDGSRSLYELDECGGTGKRLSGGLNDHTLYALTELLDFDYDQKMKVIKQAAFVVASEKTYRETFPPAYFEMLATCAKERYTFVIFGYDTPV